MRRREIREVRIMSYYRDDKEVKTMCSKCRHTIEPLEVYKKGTLVGYQCPHCEARWALRKSRFAFTRRRK